MWQEAESSSMTTDKCTSFFCPKNRTIRGSTLHPCHRKICGPRRN
uniref:Uncharacterized protein n=1 Tax=Aegilops tauschii subsp. strangulata TaxID=200361 RepID=A0A453D367_AEGTS